MSAQGVATWRNTDQRVTEVINESELGPECWDRQTHRQMDGWTLKGCGGGHKQRIIMIIIFSFSGGTKRVNYGQEMVLIDQVTRYKIMEFGSEM